MHKFKNNVSNKWLLTQELRFFRNFITNWNNEVEDSDFFAPCIRGSNMPKEEVFKSILTNFNQEELSKVKGTGGGSYRGNDEITEAVINIWNQPNLRNKCRAMLLQWCDTIEKNKIRRHTHKDPMELRMDNICNILHLNDIERDLIIYAVVRRLTCFGDFPVGNRRRDENTPKDLFYAMALDCPYSMVVKAMSNEGRIRKYEVLDSDGVLTSANPFLDYIRCGDGDVLEKHFYRQVSIADALPWESYDKLIEEHGAILKEMVAAATKGRGANILLYGAPGTGKTSFVKTLARELGLDLYEIRQEDREGEVDLVQSRITGIRICNDQVQRGKSIIMVDEADQLLRTSRDSWSGLGGDRNVVSEKGVINSIMDDVKHPTIWLSNAAADTIDDSVRRRFDYSIRFEKLNGKQRQVIWRNNIKKLHMEKLIGLDMVEQLAERYQTNAGGITMVLENVKRMKPRKGKVLELVDKLMKPHCELMGIKTKEDKLSPSQDYSLDGLNITGDLGLDRIVGAVRKFRDEKDEGCDLDRPRMNLLLWGPPGTGKTEFIKYLGKELNAKVLVKMGSDLLSMYVGGTEQNIKHAFAEAEADNAILFLDEIDGLVQDRSGASKSWEVTQVNELLYQMENFKGVMVGATNFMNNLDQAIMRRFTFKLQFNYLGSEGKCLFFERMFKTKLTRDEAAQLAAIANLTPGDFRTVRQALYYLGGKVTNVQRLAELAKESAIKKVSKCVPPIGFTLTNNGNVA